MIAGAATLLLLASTAPLSAADSSSTGSLQIASGPSMRVYVDGRLAGVTAADGLLIADLQPGQHSVLVRRSNFLSRRFTVTIIPGTVAQLDVSPLKRNRRIRYRPQEEPVDMTVESPPMFADDTGTPGDHVTEFNIVVDADLSHDDKSYETPLFDFNYGVGENLQLKYEVPYEISRTTTVDDLGNSQRVSGHGIGNSTAGVKYRFYDNDETSLALAVYPQVQFRTPGAKLEEDGGGATNGTTWILPLLMTKEFKRVAMSAESGIEYSTEERQGRLFGGAGLGTRLTDTLALLAEVAGMDVNISGQRRILVNVGFRKQLSKHRAAGAALGHDLTRGGGGDHHTYITASYQLYFGKE